MKSLKRFWSLAAVGLIILTACPGGDITPDAGEPCSEGRVCPRACTDEAGCSPGEVCTDGVCGQPAPTASRYSGCSLDADCPSGDHCSLGACMHVCLSDRDCASPTVCTNRGRCTQPEQVTSVPPPPAPQPAALEVSAESLAFGRNELEQSLILRNSGGQPLTFRALSDDPWVSVEPSTGTVSGQPLTLKVRVDPVAAGTDRQANLRLNTTAGFATVRISKNLDISGHYAGEVRITSPFEVAQSTLVMHLQQAAASTTLLGYVDPERSLLFPARSGVTGSIEESGAVTATFILAGAPGSAVNPHLSRALRRTVTLRGTVDATGLFSGELTDAFQGPRVGTPLELRGTFRLRRVGPVADGQADAPPDVSFPAVSSPFTSHDAALCTTSCPVAGGCSTDLRAADTFLEKSATFYRAFATAATTEDVNPHQAVIGTTCGAGLQCLNSVALRCAQFHYDRHLNANPGDADAIRGLLDTFEVLADYGVLFGNDKLVTATEAWKSGTTVLNELPVVTSSHAYFTAGSHTVGANQPLGMLDPYALELILTKATREALRSGSSRIPVLLGDGGGRSDFEHLRRQVLAVGGALRARYEQADREHRLGRVADARATAWRGAMQAYIDVALVSELLGKAEASAAEVTELSVLLRDFQSAAKKFDDLNAGRNPAGYLPSYVPFLFSVSRLPANNFEQIHAFAVNDVYRGLAAAEQGRAEAAKREFEQRSESFVAQVADQLDDHELQMNDLCGTQELSLCGQPGSQVAAAYGEANAARLRLMLVEQRMLNLTEEIRIEQERAARQVGLNELEARLITADGKQYEALEYQEAEIETAAALFSAAGGIFGALSQLPNPAGVAGMFGAIGQAQSSLISITGKTQIDVARTRLQTVQRARVEYNQAQSRLIDSSALVQTKMLETASLAIELELAKESLSQAVAGAMALIQRAQLLRAQQRRLQANNGSTAYRSLQFRVYADDLNLKAQRSFRLLMDWAYLASRALEYELNVTYGPRETLWAARNADDVNSYLVNLNDFYMKNRPGTPQTNTDVYSLRDQLLELATPQTDAVTGRTYTSRERFRHYVADPANRDANGNLRLSFMTHRPDKPVFSRAVCNDRIRSVRINLVGDNLGAGVTRAYVRLAQGGTNYLRDCNDGNALVAYNLLDADQRPRVARVQAGINSPNQGQGLGANTDLMYRSLLAGPWELIIDQRASVEPDNAALDLSGLDDIELVIEHDSYTLQ